MLVLTRKTNQAIEIEGGISILVVGVDMSTGEVRLGIEAPRERAIWRREIGNRKPRKTEGVSR